MSWDYRLKGLRINTEHRTGWVLRWEYSSRARQGGLLADFVEHSFHRIARMQRTAGLPWPRRVQVKAQFCSTKKQFRLVGIRYICYNLALTEALLRSLHLIQRSCVLVEPIQSYSTRGQWPYRRASEAKSDLKFEISDLNYPLVYCFGPLWRPMRPLPPPNSLRGQIWSQIWN